ncbi:xpr1 [Symbiodinium natans]|uniref:Xpr1 protein n=1 Tax=Symbiodinium natans TaxID=878477 RepID=A0A812UEV6_9DINO|nr:xpr1 [Symbiodinium natans]
MAFSGMDCEALVRTLDQCLDQKDSLGQVVSRHYRRLPAHHTGIRAADLQEIFPSIAQALGLPPWIFDGAHQVIDSFDLNGNGMLEEDEAKRITWKLLQQKRLEIGGRRQVKVPFSSVKGQGYTVVKELGRGGQGTMYLCTKWSWFRKSKYCIKFYEKADANAGGLDELMDEYMLMASLDDRHIAKTYEVFQDSSFYYLVNEPYFGGDLSKLGKNASQQGVRMGENWWRQIFRQCLDGLCYLHANGVMHCDIKEPNIMISKSDSFQAPLVVLIDFGLASAFTSHRQGVCGTPGYIPPETWRHGIWYPRGDVFSMGVVFFQCMCGMVPSKNGSVQGALVEGCGSHEDLSLAAQSRPDAKCMFAYFGEGPRFEDQNVTFEVNRLECAQGSFCLARLAHVAWAHLADEIRKADRRAADLQREQKMPAWLPKRCMSCQSGKALLSQALFVVFEIFVRKQQPPQPSRYSSNALSSSQELEKVAHPTANGNGHVQGEEESSSKGKNVELDNHGERKKMALPTMSGVFVDRGIDGLNQQLEELKKLISESGLAVTAAAEAIDAYASADEESSHMKLHALQALGNVSIGVQRLRAFAELNYAALYKILKKHDKTLKTKFGLEHLFPRLVKETNLSDHSRLQVLNDEVKELSMKCSQTSESPEVACLIHGLGRTGRDMTLVNPISHRSELVLSFFLGSSLALFLAIGVLLALPEKSPKTFSEAYFLTPIPVFRVVFSYLLILWCMGAVAKICDQWDVNHLFILNVDPRCRVTPEFFFARAATLTTIWILIFGMYVVDYKWKVLPTVWASDGFNKRSSFHFVFYPLTLLLLAILGTLAPSTICRNRYKISVLQSVKRTGLAPVYSVDFADNMVGDVLTSLAKPIEDVPAAVCYLLSHHPQEEDVVKRFVANGDSCSAGTHRWVVPALAALPFWFRALQCCRRYADTKEQRHLWNLGKYLCSLLVVIVSRMESLTLLVAVSTTATLYAFFWDVGLDWGLSYKELLYACPCFPCKSTAAKTRSNLTVTGRQFPIKAYVLCSLMDIFARSTWVFTLMPTSLVTGNIVARVILVSVMSSIEIIRRSMWAVLRIEYEQVSNASGFRALLWVPSKLNASSTAQVQPERNNSVSGGPSHGVLVYMHHVPWEQGLGCDTATADLEAQRVIFRRFPQSMPLLRDLIETMTLRERRARPVALVALGHDWFKSSTDAELPSTSLHGLLGCAMGHEVTEELSIRLSEANTLHALRQLQQQFQERDRRRQGTVDAEVALELFVAHGVPAKIARRCIESSGPHFPYVALMNDLLASKERYGYQYVLELFQALDVDSSGSLSLEELRGLMGGGVFKLRHADDVEQLLSWMDTNQDGTVSFGEFLNVALEYGQINTRAEGENTSPSFWAGLGLQGWGQSSSGSTLPARSMPTQKPSKGSSAIMSQMAPGSLPGSQISTQVPDGPPKVWRLRVGIFSASSPGRPEVPGFEAAYCMCSLCGEDSASKAVELFRTGTVRFDGQASWNIEEELLDYQPPDGLEFAIVCQGQSERLLGKARLSHRQFFPLGCNTRLTLSRSGGGIQGTLWVKILVMEDDGQLVSEAPLQDPSPVQKLPGRGYNGYKPAEDANAGMSVTWGRSWVEERQPVLAGFRSRQLPPAPPPVQFVQHPHVVDAGAWAPAHSPSQMLVAAPGMQLYTPYPAMGAMMVPARV